MSIHLSERQRESFRNLSIAFNIIAVCIGILALSELSGSLKAPPGELQLEQSRSGVDFVLEFVRLAAVVPTIFAIYLTATVCRELSAGASLSQALMRTLTRVFDLITLAVLWTAFVVPFAPYFFGVVSTLPSLADHNEDWPFVGLILAFYCLLQILKAVIETNEP